MKTKQSPRKILETFGTLYADEDVLKNLPPRIEGELEFFTLGKYVSDDELKMEYESRDFIPADPLSIAEYHQKNPTFADEYKHTATHWQDAQGKWCFVAFYRWDGERYVFVRRCDSGWGDDWWFPVVRKSSSQNLGTDNSALKPLDLDSAIKICKENGLIVYKPL